MEKEEMKEKVRVFILSWGKELPPEERAPAPLTNWLRGMEKRVEKGGEM